MSSGGEPPTSQAFTPFWIAGPGSPSTPVVGNPVANPVPSSDLGTLGAAGVASTVPPTMSQDITTMANAVPHDDFTNGLPETQPPQQPQQPGPPEPQTLVEAAPQPEPTLEAAQVARYMGLPQSTVMSVVQVFKKEHRIHKKTATGRKRRLTTAQEFQLFEMSQERENISVDEIRTRFLQLFPEFGHISKTTIYRTLERGKKGLIGMDPPPERYLEPIERYWGPKKRGRPKKTGTGLETSANHSLLEPSVSIMEETGPIDTTSDKDISRQRRSLSIAEREMIISLFFNENRTIREVADFMHLAKSTVSSVVQVFKKEHRIQRKTSTGRKKKLSDEHEQMIMDILSHKEDITIEETRNRFLSLNPEVPNISKSTIYRIMENCQSKLRARSDMEVFVGTFVHSTEDSPMVVLTDMVMGVLNTKIEFMESLEELDHLKAEYGFTDSNIHYMTPSQFMMPGMIDTHIHASQFPNNGVAMDLPLLEWLQTYTFPTEANFSDTLFAREVYSKVVERLLRNGTTTAAYFGTIHLEGSKILADVVHDKGQRALIGKVNMMRNCPEYYRELSVQESIKDTEEFIRYIRSIQSPLVQPIVTPRFAPTCPEDQLASLGQLAVRYGCHIQSHLCETQPECNWVKELFPWAKSYTDVYDSMRLLSEKSIMAHCIWLADEEIYTLRERGVGIAHCPNSNISIRSGLCDIRRLLNHGLKVGLGTDCSGGYSSSMLDALRQALQVSNVLALDRDQDYQRLTFKEAFRMATLGGAKVLNMEDRIGNFEIDKEFDALLIDVSAPGSAVDIFSKDTIEDKIQKFLYTGDDRNIARVYVAGHRILDLHNKNLH
ncbi:Guanine deaminase-like 1 [Homarus americanus]|uniref:Guanine deaminase n=1 Tax=Homarus americanus TaxID=6706 RepID=A0A8J5K7T7_HOMAM|nr:Guanine deaminase-like 1 [Homarus americanus]